MPLLRGGLEMFIQDDQFFENEKKNFEKNFTEHFGRKSDILVENRNFARKTAVCLFVCLSKI